MASIEHFNDLPLVDYSWLIEVEDQQITYQGSGKARFIVLSTQGANIVVHPFARVGELSGSTTNIGQDILESEFAINNDINWEGVQSFLENDYAVSFSNSYIGYYPSQYPNKGTFNADCPIFVNRDDWETITATFTEVIFNFTTNFVNTNEQNELRAGAIYPMAFTKSTAIFHDIYVWKETEDDKDYKMEIINHCQGEVPKYDFKFSLGGIAKDDHTDIRFGALSYKEDEWQISANGKNIIEYDGLKDFFTSCARNNSFKNAEYTNNKVFGAIYFYDRLYTREGSYNDYYSQIGGIASNLDDIVLENPLATGGFDYVRFFKRKPTEEEEEQDPIDIPEDDNDDKDQDDDPRKIPDDGPDDDEDGDDEGSLHLFHECYQVSDEQMVVLRNKMWTQDYYNVLKVQENPIENIVSSKRIPLLVSAGSPQNIIIGNIDMGAQGIKISRGVQEFFAGHTTIGGQYQNFLDYQANLGIYLPFVGYKDLDARFWMYKEIGVLYKIDIVSGICKAILLRGEGGQSLSASDISKRVAEYEGTIGIDCSITASTQRQSELANSMRYSNAVGNAIGSIGQVVGGVGSGNVGQAFAGATGLAHTMSSFINSQPTNHFQSTQANAPISTACGRSCRILYDFPVPNGYSESDGRVYPQAYADNVGYPTGKTARIGSFRSGTLVKTGGDVDLYGLTCTKEEQNMIKNLLNDGVYI